MLKLRFVWICFLLLGPKIYLKADAPLNLTKLSLEELMDLEVASAHSEPPGAHQIDSVIHPPAPEQGTHASESPIAPDLGELNAIFPVKNIRHPDEWLPSPSQETVIQQADTELDQSPVNGQDLIPIEKGNAPQNHPPPVSENKP